MQRAHLITGGTGFVGSALIVELLLRTDVHVIALVRPGQADPQRRLLDAVREAAEAYGQPLSEETLARCVAVPGDVTEARCGVETLPAYDYEQLWHSAASLRFEDRYAEQIYAINAQGTIETLELAAFAGVAAFNYISTAYVAGCARGLVAEGPVGDARPNNHYEASKIKAEASVAQERRFGVRILRPSIVIGHSRTLAATNFTGAYGFLRKLYGFNGVMARAQAGLLQERSMRLIGQGESPIDLVPIDHVAADAVTVALRSEVIPGLPRYFHLTSHDNLPVAEAVGLMFDTVGMTRPTFVQDDDELEWLDDKFNDGMDFYRSYLRGDKVFDRSAVDAVVGVERGARQVGADELRRHFSWYIDRLQTERASLPAAR